VSQTGKVSGVQAIPGQEQNTITWNKSLITGVTGYKVYGGTSPNPSTLLTTISSVDTTFYLHAGLTNGTTYYYRVTATIPAVSGVSAALETPVASATEVSAAPALTQTTTFTASGAAQSFTVPSGINWIYVDAQGSGISGPNATWGAGGRVTGWMPVTPGETLQLYMGGKPATVNGTIVPGWNGGGTSSYSDLRSYGGGATDIRRGGSALSNRIIVAGGGGGLGASSWGGPGGALVASTDAAGQVAGGAQAGPGVQPGSTTQVFGTPGTGANSTTSNGGAGGGGYYGGNSATSYGGGGGSSYTDASIVAVNHTAGANQGAGQISLTWAASPVVVTDVSVVPGQEQNTISWSKSALTGVSGYKVYGGTSPNPTTLIATITSADTLFYLHTGLTNGTTYYYRVTATIPAVGINAAIETPVSAATEVSPYL
jgi:hypothetical protein